MRSTDHARRIEGRNPPITAGFHDKYCSYYIAVIMLAAFMLDEKSKIVPLLVCNPLVFGKRGTKNVVYKAKMECEHIPFLKSLVLDNDTGRKSSPIHFYGCRVAVLESQCVFSKSAETFTHF